MAAGESKRLRPLTDKKPKTLLPLGEKENMSNFSLVLDYKTPDNLALPADDDWQRYLTEPLYVGKTKEGRFAITKKEVLE